MADVRVTRQYIEAITEHDALVRVTRLHLEVLLDHSTEVRVTRHYLEVLAEVPAVGVGSTRFRTTIMQ